MKKISTFLLFLLSAISFGGYAQQSPDVYTMGQDRIDDYDFNFYGAINGYGEDVAFSFVYSTDENFGSSTTSPAQNKAIDSLEVIWATINGLNPATTYYYYLTATTSNGTVEGKRMSFFSDTTAFLFANTGVDIYGTYGELHATIEGFQTSAALSFDFGFTPDLGIEVASDLETVTDANKHYLRAFPPTLLPDTLYFFRAKAITATDTILSDIRAFFTGNPYAIVETPGMTNVTSSSADINLNVQGFPVPVKIKSEIHGGSINHWHTPLEYYDYTTSLINYTFNATGLDPDQHFMVRLKVETWIGNFYVDTAVTTLALGIAETTIPNNELSVYPNPANNNLTVEVLKGLDEKSVIQIFDINGRLVKGASVPAHQMRTSVDVSDIKPGFYLLKLISGNKALSKKISVIR